MMKTNKTVLLVEDDPFTRFMMREIIKTLGVDVIVADDGEDGMERVRQDPAGFGLVLMDLHMPKKTGIEATQEIRASEDDPPRDVPIIAVTADVNYHDDALVRSLGMNGFVSKPVSPGELLHLIDRYCVAA
ncbi:MAG: response regulator [Pelagimonas sp.]|jgi:CheY-like chemotaxis protein|nr:response regulator [Pelagimonas sp.]